MRKTILRSLKIVYDSSRILFLLCVFTTLFSAVLSGVGIYSLQNLVNSIQIALESNEDVKKALFKFFIINICTAIISYIDSFTKQKVINNTNYYLDNEFIAKCSILPLKDYENEKTYDAISRANELGKYKIIDIYFGVLQFINSIISILTVITIVLQMDKILWFMVIIIPLISTAMNIKIGKFAYSIEKNNIEHSRQKNYINY